MNLKNLIVAAGLLAASTFAASAATLTGDSVTVNLTANSNFGTQTVVVGVGPDANYFGNQNVDLNAGISGDILTLSSTSTFGSIDGVGGDPVVWTFGDLDFSGGETLIGFNFIQSFSNVVATITANSLTLTYDDVAIPSGIYLQGQFVTSGSQTPAVPLPASALLLLGGLFGLVTVKRRTAA
ncbi:MAG: VPLPA-CTERM sorting domain-containing protein [Pseudomonadota bacterium]